MSFIGIEQEGIDETKKENWEFPELMEALDTGFLSNRPYPLYMFMGAQRKDMSNILCYYLI